MRETYRRPSLFWPLIFIGLGVLLTLHNLGLLPQGLWAALAQLWPVVFILIGLDMLLGRRSAAAVGGALLIAGLVVALALGWAALRASQLPPGQTEAVVQFGHAARRLDARLDFQAGELRVGALDDSAYVMEGSLRHGAGESAAQSYDTAGGLGRLTLSQQADPFSLPFLAWARTAGGADANAAWDVRLDPALPLTLSVSAGAGSVQLDLTGLNVARLDLTTGVGQTEVRFPAHGAITGRVRSGAGQTLLALPPGLPARLTISPGLASVRVPARFAQSGRVYTTGGFSPEGDYLDLEINASLGRVEIE